VTVDAAKALGGLPVCLRNELMEEYRKITVNYRELRWETAELNGGRFCEIVYSILDGFLSGGAYPDKAKKPPRFNQACVQLESRDAKYPDSARLTIPRVLVGLYDMRNRRGVGHVGGEVDANHMDATYVLHSAQWVMAELVRIFHSTSTLDAGKIADSLVDRTLPVVWNSGNNRRILDTTLSVSDATLLLLYSELDGVSDKSLASDLEQDRLDNYRRVLRRLHSQRLVEYDKERKMVIISPLGNKRVEDNLLS
jgi:hypothetical protein